MGWWRGGGGEHGQCVRFGDGGGGGIAFIVGRVCVLSDCMSAADEGILRGSGRLGLAWHSSITGILLPFFFSAR